MPTAFATAFCVREMRKRKCRSRSAFFLSRRARFATSRRVRPGVCASVCRVHASPKVTAAALIYALDGAHREGKSSSSSRKAERAVESACNCSYIFSRLFQRARTLESTWTGAEKGGRYSDRRTDKPTRVIMKVIYTRFSLSVHGDFAAR
jgi:hypothetical protein